MKKSQMDMSHYGAADPKSNTSTKKRVSLPWGKTEKSQSQKPVTQDPTTAAEEVAPRPSGQGEKQLRSIKQSAVNARLFSMSNIQVDRDNPRELLLSREILLHAPSFDFSRDFETEDKFSSALKDHFKELSSYFKDNVEMLRQEMPKAFCGKPLDIPLTDEHLVQRALSEYESVLELAFPLDTPWHLVEPIVLLTAGRAAQNELVICAGERRFLAHLLRAHTEILGVHREIPPDTTKSKFQWDENESREGLTLANQLSNIYTMCLEHCKTNNIDAKGNPVSALKTGQLRKLIGKGKTINHMYRRVLTCEDPRIFKYIALGQIGSLKVAYHLAQTPESPLFEKLSHGLAVAQSDIDDDPKVQQKVSDKPKVKASTKARVSFKKYSQQELAGLEKIIVLALEHLSDEDRKQLDNLSDSQSAESIAEVFDSLVRLYSREGGVE